MFLYILQKYIAFWHFIQEQHERAEVSVSIVSPADGFDCIPFSYYIHLSLKSSILLKLIPILHAFPPIQVVFYPGINQVCYLGCLRYATKHASVQKIEVKI